MRDEAIVEALKRTSLPQCQPICRKPGTATTLQTRDSHHISGACCRKYGGCPRVCPRVTLRVSCVWPSSCSSYQGTCAILARRPGRTPSPQDLQLETPPQYTLAGNPVVAPHLPLRASLLAAGCFGRPLPVCLLSHLRNSQGSQKRLLGIRSGAAGLSEYHREGRMYLLLLCQRIARPDYRNRFADRAAFLPHQACPSIGDNAFPVRQIFAVRRRQSLPERSRGSGPGL